ncbi:MAG: hypothetical protein L3J39_00040 [Verrucomicrobiales bacterium]|nr:hypothetical protein [Verrucomicrobiales bacterium]
MLPPHRLLSITSLLLILFYFNAGAQAQQTASSDSLAEKIQQAFKAADYTQVISLTEKAHTTSSLAQQARSAAFERRGEQAFFNGKMNNAIADFDSYIALNPSREPHHWQRGIAYYYAKQYLQGKSQFEVHQTVNSQDVENAVWHFLCAVRCPGAKIDDARKTFIPIDSDQRIPMKEIHALFAGSGSPEAVIAAAQSGSPDAPTLRNQLCYAHLYLGLYYEALGETQKSAKHIRLAATDYKMHHYMGKVAQVHAKLRGIE